MKKIFLLLFLLLPLLLQPYQVKELPNGLTLIWEERNSPLVYIQVWVRAGSALEEGFYGSGISHFVEHMVFKGGEKGGEGEIARKVRKLGGDMGAYTSFDHTVYWLNLPRSSFREGMGILFQTIFHPAFPSQEVEKEREVILREMDMREDNPDSFLSSKFFQLIYFQHPFGFPVIGYRPIFNRLKREDLILYHKRMYVPGNIILGIAGGVREKELEEVLKDTFTRLPARPLPHIQIPERLNPIKREKTIFHPTVKNERIMLGFPIPGLGNPDTYSLDLLSSLLTRGETSILERELKKKGIVLGVNSYSFTPPGKGIFAIKLTLKKDKRKEALRRLWEILRNPGKYFTSRELDKIRKSLLLETSRRSESLRGRLEKVIADYFYTGNPDYTSEYLREIGKIRKKDIIEVARRYLREENSTLVILTSTREKEGRKVSFSQGSSKITLPNGVRIILWQKKVPYVNIRAVLKGGIILENSRINGISLLLSRLLLESKKGEVWVKRIEEKGGSISSYTGNNSWGISIILPSGEEKLGIQALSDLLLNPEWDKEKLSRIKEEMKEAIRRRKETPFSYAFYTLRKNFYRDHPYALSVKGEEESVEKLSLPLLKEFYFRKLLNPRTLIIGVGGTFSPSILKPLEKKLSRLKSLPTPTLPPLKPSRGRKEIRGEFRESVIFVAFPIPPYPSEDLPRRAIIEEYLTGQASPIFLNLRGKRALGYLAGSFTFQGWDTGMLVFYIATRKERIEEAEKALWEEIERIQKEGIGAEEFEGIRKETIRVKWEGEQTLENLLFQSLLSELYGLGYRFPLGWEKELQKVRREEVNKTLRKYLNPSLSFTLILSGKNLR